MTRAAFSGALSLRRSAMFARILLFGCLAAVALTASSVNAQTLHKSIMPDGSVVY